MLGDDASRSLAERAIHISAPPRLAVRSLAVVVLRLHHALAVGAAGFRGHFAFDDPGAAGAEAEGGNDGEYDTEQFHGQGVCLNIHTGRKAQILSVANLRP
jgi:hypothetical protein